MKRIKLTQGKTALVDDEDYKELVKHEWCAHKGTSGGYYAIRHITLKDPDWPKTKKYRTVRIQMAQQIMNPGEGFVVDHINRNGLDNRRKNLRICTPKQNFMNRSKKTNTSSRYKGVYYDKITGKWAAAIGARGGRLGKFAKEADAAKAYDKAAIERYGEFAALNFTN